MPNPPYTLDLCYDTLNFRVLSPASSHLKWIEEFFLPHFRRGGDGGPSIEVRLRIDPLLHHGLLERLGKQEVTPAFLLDSDVVLLPTIPATRGEFTLYDPHYDAFFLVSADHRTSTVLIGEDTVRVRSAMMRVIREYVMNHAHRGGGFFLHASCFLSGERPVVVTGPKNAGKTTLLLFACLHGGGRFLANDRVLVRRSEKSFLLRGIPAIVSVRKPTIDFFPEVGRQIHERGFYFRLNSEEDPGDVHPPQKPFSMNRFLLTPLQFCRLAGTVQVAGGRDPVIVIPRVTGRPGLFSYRRLSPGESTELLRDSLFGARHWVTSTPVFNLSGDTEGPSEAVLVDRCREFLERSACLLCEVGTDLYGREASAAGWITGALEAAR